MFEPKRETINIRDKSLKIYLRISIRRTRITGSICGLASSTSTGTVSGKKGISMIMPSKSEIINIHERSLTLDIYTSTHQSFPEPEGTGKERTGASAMENPARMDATESLI